MKSMKGVLFAATLAVMFSSCGSMKNIETHAGHGDEKVYAVPYDTLFPALVEIVKSSKLVVHKIDEKNGIIYGEGKVSAWSWGEYVGIWVTRNSDDTKCRVEIDIERKLKTNISAYQWGDKFFNELGRIFREDF